MIKDKQQEVLNFIALAGLRGKFNKNRPDEFVLDQCPFCGKDKFSINTKFGGWKCPHEKSCPQAEGGNLDRLKILLGIFNANETMRDNSKSNKKYYTLEDYLPYHDALMQDTEGLEYLTQKRGLTEETIRHFKIGLKVYEKEGGKSYKYFTFPYLRKDKVINITYRSYPDSKGGKQIHQMKDGEHILFNEDELIGKQEVTLTEGQIDAITLWQLGIGREENEGVGSLPQGAKTVLKEWFPILEKAKTINLVFDMDEEGRKATRIFTRMFGSQRCFNIELPEKDANDFFLSRNGAARQEYDLYYQKARQMEGLDTVGDLISQLASWKQQSENLLKTKWAEVNNIWEGAEPGSLILVQGAERIGKTNWIYNLFYTWTVECRIPCLLYPFENRRDRLASRLVSIDLGKETKTLDDEDYEVSYAFAYKDAPFYIVNKRLLHSVSLDFVCELTRQAQARYGIQVFAFDHLQYLRESTKVEEDDFIMKTLHELVTTTGICFILLGHTNKATKDKIPGARDGRGSAMLAAMTDVNFTLHRKQLSVDNSEEAIYDPVTSIEIQGKYGCGRVQLYYEEKSGRFLSIEK